MSPDAPGADKSASQPTAPDRDQPGDGIALLIIDIVNRFDFEGGDALRRNAAIAARAIRTLRDEAAARGIPVVFVNDNFGEWHAEKSRLIERADDWLGQTGLRPQPDDYFIVKPQFSGFYATNLAVLLPKLGVRRLVLTGLATDICILFTAADAHMRDYRLWVPADAVAAEDTQRGSVALDIMRAHLAAETAATSDLSMAEWITGT